MIKILPARYAPYFRKSLVCTVSGRESAQAQRNRADHALTAARLLDKYVYRQSSHHSDDFQWT